MDRTFQVGIGICVVLFLVTLNIFFRDSLQHGVRDVWSSVTGSQVAVSQPPSAAPVVESAPKPKAKARKQPRPAPEPEPEPAKKEAALAAPKVETPPPPFPKADDLKAGMTKKEMMSRFGAPRFTASWSDAGALSEKFIYIREEQVTAVILRDGQVVTSRTGQNDPWARSAWWQTGSREKSESADRNAAKSH
jgi:hypothetical protein